MENRFMSDPFELFGLEPSYTIDLNELDKTYFRLQMQFHPDRAENADVENISSKLNSAYQRLKHPVKRAGVLLELLNISITNEDDLVEEESILLDIMDFQEAIMLCEDEEQATAVKQELDDLFTEEQHKFSEMFDRSNLEALSEIYIKMNYIDRLKKQVVEVEQNFFRRHSRLH